MLRLRHFLYVLALVTLAFYRARAADIYDCYNGSSEQGGNRITVNGIQSNQYVQQSYPGATVTVYLHNTLTLASIFQDAAGTLPLANPFSSSAHGVAFACIADGRYDFKYSGSTITIPFTVSDIKFCFACSGGGSGGVNPGTPKQVTRYNAAGTNVEDSNGSDDPLNGPTRWTNGLSVTTNGLAKQAVNSPNGTTINLLACADPSVTLTFQVTTCPAGTTKAFGVVDNGAGTSGNVQIYDHAYHPCVMDNQTAIGDYAVPSATNDGQCSDAGGAKPNTVEILGKVVSINSGAGTLATVDWFTGDTIAPGSGGGSGTVSTCAQANSNALFALVGTVVTCDILTTDDSAGNMTMRSLGLTDASQAGFFFQVQGTAPTLSVSHSIYVFPPSSVTTTFGIKWPGTLPTTGNCVQWSTSGSITQFTDAGAACGTGSGIAPKVNTVALTNPAIIDIHDAVAAFGFATTFTNPSGGIVQAAQTTPYTQISAPTAPTLTTNGSAGSTSYTYAVVACEDGPACAYHTPASSATAIATGNATLTSSNSINLKVYGDTLAWVRCFNIYRTASSGTPSSTGKIATCADKQFTDTGLAGDSTTAPSDNTTKLDPDGALVPLPGCASNITAPKGVDSPPCSPNAVDDEFTSTFGAPGDVNSPMWTAVNTGTNSFAATLTNGMLEMTSASQAAVAVHCFFQSITSTPASYTTLFYPNVDSSASFNWIFYIAFRESATSKIVAWGIQEQSGSTSRFSLDNYTNATTRSTQTNPSGTPNGTLLTPINFKAAYDGANMTFHNSTDGVIYTQQATEAKAAFFTTAPDQVGVCLNNNTGANVLDIDYFRRIQ